MADDLNNLLEYAAKRGISLPTDLILELIKDDMQGDFEVLRQFILQQIESIPVFGKDKNGLVPGWTHEDTWLSANGWRAMPPAKIVNRSDGYISSHAYLQDLSYASAGHTGFAGLDINNVFTDYQTTNGMRRNVVTKTANYIATATDEVIVCNKTTAMTITLPAATGTGQVYDIKNINTGVVTVSKAGDTIDGETTQTLNQWDSMTVCDYGTNVWAII